MPVPEATSAPTPMPSPTPRPTVTPVPAATFTPAPATTTPVPAVPPAVDTCLTERLGTQAAEAIASGERNPTAEEEVAVGDCLLTSALGLPPETSTFNTCLSERLGAEAAEAIASGQRNPTAEEEMAVGDCLLTSALEPLPETSTFDTCLTERLGAEATEAIASGERNPTAEEEVAVGNCLLASALSPAPGAASTAVSTCLTERLGTEAAEAIASGERNPTAVEEVAVGDCLLASALSPAAEAASPAVSTCLTDRLGAEAAEAITSGERNPTAEEEVAVGDCLLQEVLGGAP